MKPIIKYRGGKTRELPNIMQHVPRFAGRYVEPFFGGGALFFYLEPRQAIVNDINAKLMHFYAGVRDNYAELRAELDGIETIYDANRREFDSQKSLHPDERVDDKNETLYYAMRDMYNGRRPKVWSEAALYYYINKSAYSGMIRYNANGDFNVPFGRYRSLGTASLTASHSRLLQRAELFNADYADIFAMCGPDDFVFLDPPYDCVFSDYGNDGFGEAEHRRLAHDFASLPCKALMVIGRTRLTEQLYGDYIIDEYQKNYSVNIRNRFKAGATHIVVANYSKSEAGSLVPQSEPECVQLRLFEPKENYGND